VAAIVANRFIPGRREVPVAAPERVPSEAALEV
jgi:hypothetical protein